MIIAAIIISDHRELRIRPHECSKENRSISKCIILFDSQLHEAFL